MVAELHIERCSGAARCAALPQVSDIDSVSVPCGDVVSSGLGAVMLLLGWYSCWCWLVDEKLIDCQGEGALTRSSVLPVGLSCDVVKLEGKNL